MVDIDKLILDVRAIAEKYPQNQYKSPLNSTGCYYNQGNCGLENEGCLIGQAARLQPEFFEYIQNKTSTIKKILLELNISDQSKINWLSQVQSRQDCEYKWEKCISSADISFPQQKIKKL